MLCFIFTGTTWVQELIWLVCNKGDMSKAHSVPLEERFPYMEFSVDGVTSGLDLVSELQFRASCICYFIFIFESACTYISYRK